MKKIKNILIVTALYTIQLFAVDPNFELWNKTSTPINVDIHHIHNNGQPIDRFDVRIDPNAKFPLFGVDVSHQTFIKINKRNTYIILGCGGSGCFQTIYLSYENGILRPQKGPLYGLLRITDSGYDNSNNVTPEFIKGN